MEVGSPDADHHRPLNLTFLLSPDILISNTYHSVRGQLLAERQREKQRWRVGVRLGREGNPRCVLSLHLERTEESKRVKRAQTVGGVSAVYRDEPLITSVCVWVRSGCSARGMVRSIIQLEVRGGQSSSGCLAPSPTAGQLTGH